MDTAPFIDLGEAGVCARVALQLVKRARIKHHLEDARGIVCVGAAVMDLGHQRYPMIRLALLSLSVWCEQGKMSRDWLSGVLYRDLMGYTFRRCFYAEYKAGRRLTPPVSNTGGQLPLWRIPIGLGIRDCDE